MQTGARVCTQSASRHTQLNHCRKWMRHMTCLIVFDSWFSLCGSSVLARKHWAQKTSSWHFIFIVFALPHHCNNATMMPQCQLLHLLMPWRLHHRGHCPHSPESMRAACGGIDCWWILPCYPPRVSCCGWPTGPHQKQHHVPYSLAILLNGTF